MILRVTDLHIAHGNRPVIDGLTLALRPGRFLALVGPNGAGKSTLLAAIAGRLPVASGGVEWFGRPLGQWARRDLARRVALMQQSEVTGFDFLVREYVGLGRLPRRGEVSRAAEDLMIAAAMEALDVARLAGRKLPSLSGGERQRARMARCLAQLWPGPCQPPGKDAVLLLDEPTSALDLGQQARLLSTAWDFTRRGGACVAVLHDLNLAAAYADDVAVMDGGRLAAFGPPQETITARNIATLYRTAVVPARLADGGRELVALPGPHAEAKARAVLPCPGLADLKPSGLKTA